jgi:uncharacterized protein
MKRICLAFGFLLLLLQSNAQAPTEKSLLWQISGKGIKKPSYLFGTIHVMCPADLKISEVMKAKIKAAKQLYLELKMDDEAMLMQGSQMMINTDTTKTLVKLLGKKRYDTVVNFLKKDYPMAPMMANMVKPFAMMSMSYKSLMNCEPISWEMEIMKIAKENKEEVFGLELMEDQMKAIDKMPLQEQAESLYKMVMNKDSSALVFNQLLTAYKNQDVKALSDLMKEDNDMNKYEEELLLTRNRNWIPVIEKQVKAKPTFIAVGAGHLGGVNGVIDLLRKKGYKVTAVKQ